MLILRLWRFIFAYSEQIFEFWMTSFRLKSLHGKKRKHQKGVKSWELCFFLCAFLPLARAKCLDSGRSSSSVICKHCLMHVCAYTQKTDWTHPPVPDAAPHVCHGLLAQILDRTPQTFRKCSCMCACFVCVWERQRKRHRRETGRKGCPDVCTLPSC